MNKYSNVKRTNRKRVTGMAFFLAFGLVAAYLKWDEITQIEGDRIVLTAEREKQLEEKVDSLESAEVYALLAEVNGYYFCPLCPPGTTKNGKFYLNQGEVFKYGITINPRKRYSTSELQKWQLEYVLLKKASLQQCTIEEKYRIAGYPLLRENLNRPKIRRLFLPPGSGVDLR